MATCAYCHLALDGWEPSDKPFDEHYHRSPNCAFFALLNEFGGPKKRTARGRAAGGSKASRLSMQSVATTASDIASVADITVEPDDSVLTTTSTMTQGTRRTASKKKKAATTKGRTRTKKVQEVEQEELGAVEENPVSPPKTTKSTRGKKRSSEDMDDSVVILSEAPAPKKRDTTNRESSQIDGSTITPEDVALADVQASKPTSRARSSGAKSSRKPSALGASMASLRAPLGDLPDDEEIERQLEADLERPLTDDDEIAHDSESERSKAMAKESKGDLTSDQLHDYAMFNPAEIQHDEDALDDELRNLQAEMEVDEPTQKIHVDKKGRKPGTGARKASKQTRAKKAKAPSPSPEPEPEAIDPPSEAGEPEVSIGSTNAVVVENTDTMASPRSIKAPRRAVKSSPSSKAESKPAEAPAKRVCRPSEATAEPIQLSESTRRNGANADDRVSQVDGKSIQHESAGTPPLDGAASPPHEASSPAASRSRLAVEPPSTPPKLTSPATSARQPALSPSPSPQPSDAENLPPSSAPPASAKAKRVVLAPVTATPARNSPSKRNMLAAGLQSQTQWTAVDIDAVLGTPHRGDDKENAVSRLLKQGKELTSPEKRMTVEEWIYFNAGEAERKLKHECESMVTQFEREGTRAMNVLEGLSVE
ncbi:Inhibitor of Apoptosis domain containing protein [Metarhizium album ARSEF 1941]|uniref:Inhibitor of Apoptosis domain containing protein n=1 Tax=Metarhizium album (strain ARSEF 1941) TaxID=1081103 RepID=A0A0B2WU91_METAS|nr:Inhibitor of Apoptosis domain containing protein [Metarhizium album ARSEF 1941]KHN97037.1 Inhibitor of Apoptosis domain containing protein [Metarhizium album ARSEF 1941]